MKIWPLLLIFPSFAFAQVTRDKLKLVLDSGIDYIVQEQNTEDNYPYRLKGEWPSFMMNDHSATLLGKAGKKAWDSNCFTTASIYNSLAEIYKKRPEYKQIPATLNLAMDNILQFESDGKFGFWLVLPRTLNLYPENERAAVPEVRRPNNYVLDNAFVNNASNVPEDADDTAVAYLAIKKHNELAQTNPQMQMRKLPDESFENAFTQYRDQKRKSLHYYNIVHGQNIRTKAFLTWFGKERIMTPWSWLPIKNNSLDNPYIPYGANEVDCVVNTNILNTLASYRKTDIPGYQASCQFVNKAISTQNFAYCGLYYPNHYEIHYTAAKAFKAGASCLQESVDTLIQHITQTQAEDGSFESYYARDFRRKFIERINNKNVLERLNDKYWRKEWNPKDQTQYDDSWLNELDAEDKIQSTAYAIAALIKLGNQQDPVIKETIEKGIQYLLDQAQEDKDGHLYWKGGVFFAGGTLVRDDIRWRSDAYTTAIIMNLISEYID